LTAGEIDVMCVPRARAPWQSSQSDCIRDRPCSRSCNEGVREVRADSPVYFKQLAAMLVECGPTLGIDMATEENVLATFEQFNVEGRDYVTLNDACNGLAQWLASAWDRLEEGDAQILVAVGATLWREGYSQR